MNRIIPWCYAALASTALLVVACVPDDSGSAGDQADNDAGLDRPPVAGDRDAGGAARTAPPPPPNAAAPGAPGAAVTPGTGAAQLVARAEMRPVGDGTARGTVEFRGGGAEPLTISVMMMGLPAGPHGFHVHSGADCMMHGEHWNPTNAEHGALTSSESHRGDLGNVTADAAGMVQEAVRSTRLGEDSSYIGKPLVLHENQDDFSTQPDGGSGEPLACGVIEAAEGAEISQAPGEDRGV